MEPFELDNCFVIKNGVKRPLFKVKRNLGETDEELKMREQHIRAELRERTRKDIEIFLSDMGLNSKTMAELSKNEQEKEKYFKILQDRENSERIAREEQKEKERIAREERKKIQRKAREQRKKNERREGQGESEN